MICGDVYYNVLITQPQNEGEAVNITGLVNRFINVTGLNNSLSVTITVTAIDRVGQRNDSISDLQLRTPEGKFM